MKERNFTVGEISARFLNALSDFQEVKDELLFALCAMYGDDDGEKFYNSHAETLDAVERIIMEYLRVQFSYGMACNLTNIEL